MKKLKNVMRWNTEIHHKSSFPSLYINIAPETRLCDFHSTHYSNVTELIRLDVTTFLKCETKPVTKTSLTNRHIKAYALGEWRHSVNKSYRRLVGGI